MCPVRLTDARKFRLSPTDLTTFTASGLIIDDRAASTVLEFDRGGAAGRAGADPSGEVGRGRVLAS